MDVQSASFLSQSRIEYIRNKNLIILIIIFIIIFLLSVNMIDNRNNITTNAAHDKHTTKSIQMD